MGAVYMAQQIEPVRRLVAIKLIKPGMDSRQILARFEAERQALALMDHPNIARVFDAGNTEQGRPFFVMELVKGPTITRYCDEQRLSPRERLSLFVQVCEAVQHAHQKGIIHRDIKPSNVLVARYDGRPVPKVIDFGIAKATGPSLTDRTLVTGFGSVVGHPRVHGPRAGGAEPAGRRHAGRRLRAGRAPLRVVDRVAAAEPAAPRSGRRCWRCSGWSERRNRRPRAAGSARPRPCRRSRPIATEPRRLTALVRGDLDWIALKALEKDRSRRYATANALARDVQRYLSDEPVEAGPPTAIYRLRKFARRYRNPLAVASAVAALLVAATAISVYMAYRAAKAEDAAVKAGGKTKDALDLALAQEKVAREESATRLAVQKFFVDKIFSAGRPKGFENGLGPQVTLREAIEAAVPGIVDSFRDRPAVEGAIRHELGGTYYYLGEFQKCYDQLKLAVNLRLKALGPEDPETLRSQNDFAIAARLVGRGEEGLALSRKVNQARERVLGRNHKDTLTGALNLATELYKTHHVEEAEKLFESLIPRLASSLGPTDSVTLNAKANLSALYLESNRFERAADLYEKVGAESAANPKIGPRHAETIQSFLNAARSYMEMGHYEKAFALYKTYVPIQEEVLTPNHLYVLGSMRFWALCYEKAGRDSDAIPLREAVRARQAAKPVMFPLDSAMSLGKLADNYLRNGRIVDAIKIYEEAVAAAKWGVPDDHPATLGYRSQLAEAKRKDGQKEDAITLLGNVVAASTAKAGPDDPRTIGFLMKLIDFQDDAGHPDRATALADEFLAGRGKRLAPDDPKVAGDLLDIGKIELKYKRYPEAIRRFGECLAIREAKLPGDWVTFDARSLLGEALLAQGDPAAAAPLLRTGFEGIKAHAASIPPGLRSHLVEALDRLISYHEAAGDAAEVARLQAERMAIVGNKPSTPPK